MSHTINDLREHLFATTEGLRDKKNPLAIDRAKAVAEVAQTIINSAKVEVEHMKVSGEIDSTGFLAPATLPGGASPTEQAAPRAGLTVVQDDRHGKTTVETRNGMTITRHKAK